MLRLVARLRHDSSLLIVLPFVFQCLLISVAAPDLLCDGLRFGCAIAVSIGVFRFLRQSN